MQARRGATARSEISERHARELAELGTDYWWFGVRLHQVCRAVRRQRPGGVGRYLDFGCGSGRTTRALLRALAPREALALDGTDALVEEARAAGVPAAYADFRRPLELPFRPELVTALDVLEHVADDEGVLRRLADAAAPAALLVATVPALPALYSAWDDVSGHHRRYLRSTLRTALRAAGWRPLRVRYFFGWCVPPAWIERRWLRRVQEFEFPRVSPLANAALTAAGRLECALGNPLPFGTSLLATAVREDVPGRA